MKHIPNTLDREFALRVFSPVCGRCNQLLDGRARTCAAFPGGIPVEIWNGENPHTNPFPGDNGIRFTPLSDTDGEENDSQNST